ncbi:hypothetical protein A2U01_0014510 [Trifolium medium]|uniref:Uncharacterized protein n=1 Tax=Trifolium medium TaxID=97028 RepID=A0A392N3L1_9FABA|nr:hypothetical protein [Trifolium medium]
MLKVELMVELSSVELMVELKAGLSLARRRMNSCSRLAEHVERGAHG